MAVLVALLLLLAMTGHSSATYCLCKDGVSEQILQKAIDYACSTGADCTQIQQNAPCFQPNTVKSHCDYAVNSYYQKKSSAGATCDFSGAATLSNGAPSTAGSCVFPSSSGTGVTPTTGTPTTPTVTPTPPTTGTPTMGTPTTGTPSTTTGTPTTGTPSTTTGTPTTGTPSTTTGTPASVFPGTTMGPTGTGFSDQSSGVILSIRAVITLLWAIWISGLMMLWC